MLSTSFYTIGAELVLGGTALATTSCGSFYCALHYEDIGNGWNFGAELHQAVIRMMVLAVV